MILDFQHFCIFSPLTIDCTIPMTRTLVYAPFSFLPPLQLTLPLLSCLVLQVVIQQFFSLFFSTYVDISQIQLFFQHKQLLDQSTSCPVIHLRLITTFTAINKKTQMIQCLQHSSTIDNRTELFSHELKPKSFYRQLTSNVAERIAK